MMGNARPLYKTDECARLNERLVRCQRKLIEERERANTAEENARRFHALMLAARIQLISAKG